MNIEMKNKTRIYRFDGQYGTQYSMTLSRKLQNGQFENGFITCKFKKDIDIPNETDIIIKNCFLTFTKKDKKTYPYIMILDFEYANNDKKVETKKVEVDPYQEFGEQIDENSFPF